MAKTILNAIEFGCLRQSLGLSQTLTATLLNVDETTIQAWETGTETVTEIACKKLLDIDDIIEMQVLNTCDGIESMFKQTPKRQLAFVVYPEQAVYQQYNPEFMSSLPLTELYTTAAWRIKKECKLVLDVSISLIAFDVESYKAFREQQGLGESRDNRAKWAATQL